MRTAVLFILFLAAQFASSQTVIQLTHEPGARNDYHFVNPGDTAFVITGREEDMGKWTNPSYTLRTDIPDSKYSVYINKEPALEAFIKNHMPDSIWTHYLNGKLWFVTTYSNGKYASETYYYSSGKIWSKCVIENGNMSCITYDESGAIQSIDPKK